jgi:hypothetical protein
MSPGALAVSSREMLSEVFTPMSRARYEPLANGPSCACPASVINLHSGLPRGIDIHG